MIDRRFDAQREEMRAMQQRFDKVHSKLEIILYPYSTPNSNLNLTIT